MSCGCNNETVNTEITKEKNTNSNTITIDFLFLDLSVCTRCQGTEETLEGSINSASSLLKEIGYDVVIKKTHIETPKQAIQHQFISSPTIRINNQDLQMDVTESHCSTCSSLTDGATVDCREWNYKGKSYHVPPKGLIIDGVMSNIYGKTTSKNTNSNYVMPDNLVNYFENKNQLCASIIKEQDYECISRKNDASNCC